MELRRFDQRVGEGSMRSGAVPLWVRSIERFVNMPGSGIHPPQ